MSTYVAVFALVLAYFAVIGAFCALRTLAKLRRDTHLLARGTRGPNGRQSLIEATQRHAELTETVAEEIERLRAEVATSTERALAAVAGRDGAEACALRHVALVRYDAFTQASGRLSFSLAMLDDRGDGVAISAITGTDTRVYAKSIANGAGEHELSPEERQAVAAALDHSRTYRKAG